MALGSSVCTNIACTNIAAIQETGSQLTWRPCTPALQAIVHLDHSECADNIVDAFLSGLGLGRAPRGSVFYITQLFLLLLVGLCLDASHLLIHIHIMMSMPLLLLSNPVTFPLNS